MLYCEMRNLWPKTIAITSKECGVDVNIRQWASVYFEYVTTHGDDLMLLKSTLTLAALSFATASFAMSDVDANADGMLTEEELTEAVKAGVLPDISG